MVKHKRRYTGWGTRGRPFTPSEYSNSWINKSSPGMNYSNYLRAVVSELRTKRGRKFIFKK